jgi:hypothetical protein
MPMPQTDNGRGAPLGWESVLSVTSESHVQGGWQKIQANIPARTTFNIATTGPDGYRITRDRRLSGECRVNAPITTIKASNDALLQKYAVTEFRSRMAKLCSKTVSPYQS